MIPQSFIQDLLNRVDIVDVVGKYVKLKKGGANFMGLCPFHNEKSPSFTVSPTKQFYHCFGCGEHGTAVGFLMEYSGLSFPDAVKDLAQSVGMTVPQDDSRMAPEIRAEYQAKSLALTEVLTQAMNYYRQQLRGSQRAIQYLKGRGLSGEIAARFGLGYAPDGWQNLDAAFEDYEEPALLESGLVIEREAEDPSANRKRYDRFRDRIMFPIRNSKGQVIGFGGRIIDDGEPKYLNSPETPVFQKGNELYGLFEARQAIREAGFAIVVEGYMDVVALAQLGVANAVATLGTACTTTHVQKLLRQTDRVVFSFDGDSAGRRAAWRALEASLPYAADNKVLSFLFLPTEHDPDSYIREFGAEAFREQAQAALPLSAFLVGEMASRNDLTKSEGRAKAQFDAKPLLQALPAGGLRLQVVRELARLTLTTPDELTTLAELSRPSAQHSGGSGKRAPVRTKRSPPTSLEVQIMRLLLSFPGLVQELDASRRQTLDVVGHAAMDTLILECAPEGGGTSSAAVCEALIRGPEAEFFSGLIKEWMQSPEIEQENAQADLHAAIGKLRDQQIRFELQQLAAGDLADPDKARRYRELMAEQTRQRTDSA